MCENKTEPLAKTRSRRSNAGARMHEMMFAAEDDELFAQTYGGLLKADDDSSDDEEYVPKEVDTVDADEIDLDDDDDDDDDDEGNDDDNDEDSDEDEESSSEDGSDQSDNEESDINDEHNLAFSSARTKSKNIANNKRDGCEVVDNSTGYVTYKREKALIKPGSPGRSAYESCAKICCVCLGDQSGEDDEIIECDSCGVAVHESCYGVPEEDTSNEAASDQSNISSESTEPWFCEACRRSVQNPNCELCPNTGGIFKQTDTGRWVHMVCALYTRGVTFENIDTLTEVSLFELSPALFGSKTCTICEDRRLARSGICIGCDAGLCKIFFHATCAQKEGLLFESHADEVDPYFAQCKQHADKSAIKKKKRICTAIMARYKKINPLDNCSEKVKQKLAKITQMPDHHLTRWTPANPPPIPSRIGRPLMTSPSLIIKLTKKSELLGLDPQSAFMNVQDEQEAARQKWHVPPAFSLEFIAYCHDRTTRMVHLKRNNTELVNQNLKLKIEEANLRERYNSMKDVVANLRLETESMIREARNLQKSVSSTTGKQFNLPLQLEQMIARSMNSRNRNNSRPAKSTSKTSSTHCCSKCNTTKDQHLLSLCDTCNSYIHIYCLDPPLSRVPKKTKFGGWQCSDCSERDEEEQEEAQEEHINLANQDVDGPRRLRERIKYPEKYCQESMMIADFWSNAKRRSKKSRSSRSAPKKAKVEPRIEKVH